MPPRTRRPRVDEAAEQETAASPRRVKEADICRRCWPEGWPEKAMAAVCDHGSYSRR